MGSSIISTRKPPLSGHPAFVPLVAVWLAALLGGCIAVLPAGVLGGGLAKAPFAMPALATLAAIAGAAFGWATARVIHKLQHRPGHSAQASAPEVEVEEDEPVEVFAAEAVEPLQIAELEEVAAAEPEPQPALEASELEAPEQEDPEPVVSEPEVAESLVSEAIAPETDEAAEDVSPVSDVYDDAPFYADIDLAQLLGAPKVERPKPIEAPASPNPVAHQDLPAESQAETQPEPALELPKHGKAVNLLRTHDTQELAMPQLIERFAVALDDQRQLAQNSPHSYSAPVPPANLTQRLRALTVGARPAE